MKKLTTVTTDKPVPSMGLRWNLLKDGTATLEQLYETTDSEGNVSLHWKGVPVASTLGAFSITVKIAEEVSQTPVKTAV